MLRNTMWRATIFSWVHISMDGLNVWAWVCWCVYIVFRFMKFSLYMCNIACVREVNRPMRVFVHNCVERQSTLRHNAHNHKVAFNYMHERFFRFLHVLEEGKRSLIWKASHSTLPGDIAMETKTLLLHAVFHGWVALWLWCHKNITVLFVTN